MEGIRVKKRLLASMIKLSLIAGSQSELQTKFCISVNASNPAKEKEF